MATIARPCSTLETIRRAPKALLHDHLEGGLAPETVIELASEIGYRELPDERPGRAGATRFRRGADRKSLELYLEGFRHTVALMQTQDSIERVAAEAAEDLAADGVVYAEIRYAPELSHGGRSDARRALSRRSSARLPRRHGARRGGRQSDRREASLVTAMRQLARSVEIAELAVRHRDAGVVGFDIAGPEAGFHRRRHLDAFQLIAREQLPRHDPRRRGFGLPLDLGGRCSGAAPSGWATASRIVDDIDGRPPTATSRIGRLAAVRPRRRVPLEMRPTSNVQTGAVATLDEHPIDLLRRLATASR